MKTLLTQLGIGTTLSDNNVAGGKASENNFWYFPFVTWDRTPGGAPPVP